MGKQCMPMEMMAAMDDMQAMSTSPDTKLLSSGRAFDFEEPSDRGTKKKVMKGKKPSKKAFQEALQDGFQEALKEAFQGKEALKETLQEALQETFKEALKEAFREALRVQELRSFVPLYGRDESFCHGGDGDRALCSQRHRMD